MRIIRAKAVYFADDLWEFHYDSIEEEFKESIQIPSNREGVSFENVQCTSLPPFGETYSILFFDWGGMSIGNSCMESFCRQIIREAKDRPSTDYVMTSTMTRDAMKDMLDDFPEAKEYANIYLNLDDYLVSLKGGRS